ncbi:MAG: hypothetical protein ABSD74_19710 [Rhizomicrobium sp.]
MIRPLLSVTVALGLLGCGASDYFDRQWSSGVPPSVLFGERAPAPSLQSSAASPGNAHCEDVAKSRAEDAAANGYDDDMQNAVHDGTYADCITWHNAHPGGD